MSEGLLIDELSSEEMERFLAYSARVEGTNIHPQTLLATDYLNHFNEIVMLLEMIPDMPDCYEEARAWAPKAYQDHFRDSQIRDRDLAIEVYDSVPLRYRRPFEEIIGQMNCLVASSLDHIESCLNGDPQELRLVCTDASHNLQKLMDLTSAVIHGSTQVFDQAGVDGLLA
jgi:hypothetical protein